MSPYYRVVGALIARKSRRMGNNWQCPSHDDRTPSLSVKPGTHRETGGPTVLLHCHAGCSTTEEVLPALGIEPSELFGNGHRQTQLFPPSKFSPVGLDILLRLPASAERNFVVASALGRFHTGSGGRERVYSQRAIAAVIVEAKHRRAIVSTLGISADQLSHEVAKWKDWGVAHGCSRAILTIFVREETACPVCKTALANHVPFGETASANHVEGSPTASANHDSVPGSELTDSGFDIGVRTETWEPYPEVKALEWLKEDTPRRRR